MQQVTIQEPPIGGRRSSPKIREAALFVDDFKGLPQGVTHFELLRLVKRAGPSAGFSSRMIQLLEYYLLFTRESDWSAGGRPIVYQALSKTALEFGVSERQIQNLEKALFDLGALTWNDSGNHRRYGFRDENGEIVHAFGVELTPLAGLREKLEAALAKKEALNAAWLETKRQISWYRGRIRALILETADYPHLDAARFEAEQKYGEIAETIRAYMSQQTLDTLLNAHKAMHDQLLATVLSAVNNALDAEITLEQELAASTSMDDKNFAHKYSTKQPSSNKLDTSGPMDKKAPERSVAASSAITGDSAGSGTEVGSEEADIADEIGKLTLPQLVNAASDRFVAMLPRGKAPDFSDIVTAASALLPVLGIHKSAWAEACRTLGRNGAAICVLIIDQKTHDQQNKVLNPGGYLREMTARAKKGELNLHRSVFGLLKRGERRHDA